MSKSGSSQTRQNKFPEYAAGELHDEQAHAADKVGTVVGGSSSTTSTPNLLQHDEICRVLHNAVRESIIF